MRIGLLLHPERGVRAVYEEASLADDQGYDSVWLSDHVVSRNAPLDAFTLMTAIGARTRSVRLAWSMLNVHFRYPAMLAKVLATLDQITEGRVICSLGSGSNPAEHAAYNIPIPDDHDARVAYTREVVQLLKLLWTHPAPELVSFDGAFVRVRDLAFSPEPFQAPHPPIWLGGESPATLAVVKELADGWVTLTRDVAHQGLEDPTRTIRTALGAPDWPRRAMDVVLQARIFVARTHEAALAEARATLGEAQGRFGEIVGTPDECLERIDELARLGVTYLRATFATLDQQARVAELLARASAVRADA